MAIWKIVWVGILTELAGIGGLVGLAHAAKSRPNVILVFADDISARELPIYGSKVWSDLLGGNTRDPAYRAQTPVLDRLAKEGVWITNAWAATVCSPSRAMIMTGRYASIHKWWQNKDYGRIIQNGKAGPIVPLYQSSPILIGHVAQKAGYATLWAGKTQMKQCDHQRFGFDEGVFTPGSYMFGANPLTDFKLVVKKTGSQKAVVNEDTNKPVNSYAQSSWYWQPSVALMNHPGCAKPIEWWPKAQADKRDYGLATYGPDVELKFIFEFMERKCAAGQPFFIYHTSHLGHDAFDWFYPEADHKWPGTPKIHWDGKQYSRSVVKVTGDNGKYDTHGTITGPGIYHHINYIDYQIWQYLNKMHELGIENNTILIFAADNGTSKYGKASPDRQKGTHVPLIIFAPGAGFTKRGQQDILVNISDILPTLAEIVGTKMPTDYELHGQSLWPYLTTDKTEHRSWIYAYRNDMQLIRGFKVLKDGYGKWWDVAQTPDDLISFRQITDWGKESPAYRAERDKLKAILPRFDNYKTEHDFIVK